MPTIKELLVGFCGKTLKMTDAEVAELFTKPDGEELIPDALSKLLAKDATRVQEFKVEQQTQFDNGYKKAQKEDRTKFEKEVKDNFGITSDKQGLDLIKDLITTKVNDAGTLSEEQVKAHPLYITTVTEADKKVKAVEKDWKGKLDTREAEIARERNLGAVQEKAVSLLKSLNPILPEDQKKADNQLGVFKKAISEFDFKDENGTIVILKGGDIQKDAHGNLITFDDFVKAIGESYWDFKVGDGHTGAGNKTPAGGQGQGGKKGVKTYKDKAGVEKTVTAPKSKDEYSSMMAKATEANERIAIQEAYDEVNAPPAT